MTLISILLGCYIIIIPDYLAKMTYTIPTARTNYRIFNIRFQGAKVWNDISEDIKLLPLKRFKKNLKLILLDKY